MFYAKTDNGNVLIDWLILMTGIALMAVAIVISVVPVETAIGDDRSEHGASTEDFRRL